MNLTESIGAHRLLAIVRGSDRDAALSTVITLAEGGIDAIEVSLTTSDAFWVIEQARRQLSADFALGAGTVLTAVDAVRAADAGASYLVTPALGDDLRNTAAKDLPTILGAWTPTEVATAVRREAWAVKLFPASLGGPGYLRALRDPFPKVPFIPVGGVDLAAARAFLAAGALAVGVGSPLVGDAASGGDLDALRTRIAAWREALAEVPA